MAAKIKSPSASHKRRSRHKPKRVSLREFEKVYWPYIPVFLLAGALIWFSAQSGVLSSSLKNPTGKTLDYALSMNIDKLLTETNAQRIQNGAQPLRFNSKLFAAAQAKAEDMAQRNYWSHNTPDGQPPWLFVKSQYYDYRKLGENLATGFLDERGTVSGWMASKGHRENLVDPAFSEVGFGVANNADYTAAGGGPMTIIVAMYGRPVTESAADTLPTPQGSAANAVNTSPTDANMAVADNTTDGPLKLSRAQIAFASLPIAPIATGLLTVVMIAAVALWLTKHAIAVRRTFRKGEKFVIKHPLLDLGLVVVAALAVLLTRSAGLVG